MEIKQVLASIAPQKNTLLTIGVFDGVHAGHRHLINKLNQHASEKGLISGVVTFTPHPQSVLHPHSQLSQLSSLVDRVNKLRDLGVNFVAVLSFTSELACLSAQEFVFLLKKYLKMQGLVIGPAVALGKGGEGNISLLRSLGQEMKFSVETIPPFTINGEIVSSTLIRQTLDQGDMRKIKRLMGHYFKLSAKVITADKRGYKLGFPTANLDIKPDQALPGDGVYATITHVDGNQFLSATNIGTRPTFGDNNRTVETHLIRYEGNLYNKEVQVEFVARLRGEKRFSSSQELKAQIEKDIRRVSSITLR